MKYQAELRFELECEEEVTISEAGAATFRAIQDFRFQDKPVQVVEVTRTFYERPTDPPVEGWEPPKATFEVRMTSSVIYREEEV